MMKWTGKLAVLALAVSLWASPLLACMLPGAMLTMEERECCRTMADDCGDMEMPASHSCCTLTVQDTGPYMAKARSATSHAQPLVATLDSIRNTPLPETLSPVKISISIHSPPVSPPQSISILRI